MSVDLNITVRINCTHRKEDEGCKQRDPAMWKECLKDKHVCCLTCDLLGECKTPCYLAYEHRPAATYKAKFGNMATEWTITKREIIHQEENSDSTK